MVRGGEGRATRGWDKVEGVEDGKGCWGWKRRWRSEKMRAQVRGYGRKDQRRGKGRGTGRSWIVGED